MKKFVAGLIVGVLMMCGNSAFASSIVKELQIVVDGSDKTIHSMEYDDRNFVAIRDIVSATGGNVRVENGKINVLTGKFINDMVGKQVRVKVKQDVNGFDVDTSQVYTVTNINNFNAIYGNFPTNYWKGATAFITVGNKHLLNPFDVEMVK